MKTIRNLVIIILAISSYTTNAQFSIDIYSGYNHSNNKYLMPDNFDYADYKTYYTDTPYDTIYSNAYPDSIIGIKYLIRESYMDTASTKHNFSKDYVYGVNISYSYANHFRTSISAESYGASVINPDFKITYFVQRYGSDNNLFNAYGWYIDCNYESTLKTLFLNSLKIEFLRSETS